MDTFPIPICAEHAIMYREEFLWQHAMYDSWFLIIPIEGHFSCTMHGKTWTISPGELCFFPPGVIFDRQVLSPLTLHYIRIVWNRSLEKESESPYYCIGRVTVQDAERLQSTLRLLCTAEKLYVQENQEIVLHYVRDICLQCMVEYRETLGKPTTTVQDPIVAQAMDYMKHMYHTTLSIAEIAAEYGLSHALFTRRFTVQAGISPIAYLTNLRIQNAKTLLTETNLTITQVATACGYTDPFYFSKRFHKLMGQSPQMYRQRMKEL